MADAIYHFVWDQFCDWYLELIKPVLKGPGEILRAGNRVGLTEAEATETRDVASWVLDQILVMLHPFMPFITEELWHALGERNYDLIHAKWPEPEAEIDSRAHTQINWEISAIEAIRSGRAELGIAPSLKVDAWFVGETDFGEEKMSHAESAIRHRARVTNIYRPVSGKFGRPNQPELPIGPKLTLPLDGGTIFIPLEGVIDVNAEKNRLTKAIEAATKEAKSLEGRLNNPAFMEKAKPEAVEKARADHAEKAAEAERLTAALARLG